MDPLALYFINLHWIVFTIIIRYVFNTVLNAIVFHNRLNRQFIEFFAALFAFIVPDKVLITINFLSVKRYDYFTDSQVKYMLQLKIKIISELNCNNELSL